MNGKKKGFTGVRKMKWKFCEFCYINGHCENQDRGHKCECYGKKLEDKCERLEKQLKIALAAFRMIRYSHNTIKDRKTGEVYYTWHYAEMKIKDLEK